jgi:hypothetical protein
MPENARKRSEMLGNASKCKGMQRIAQNAENILNDVEIFKNILEQIEMDGNM